ncbi:hypothetical protein [Sorangium sp. So ce1078]|uniref:hypothetical protein n=1 Tax=Sorangium sp. So ce1078 TaxID=3133329 RepID=UPI003F6471BF
MPRVGHEPAPADIEGLVKDPSFTARRATALLGGLGMLGEDELSAALAEAACRRGHRALRARVPHGAPALLPG